MPIRRLGGDSSAVKARDYIVTVSKGRRTRKAVWHARESFPVDYPTRWTLLQTEKGVELREKGTKENPGKSYVVEEAAIAEGKEFALPDASDESAHDIRLKVTPLSPLPAVYDRRADLLHSQNDEYRAGYLVFCGIKEYFFSYQQIGRSFNVSIGGTRIFSFQRGRGYCVVQTYVPLDFELPTGLKRFKAAAVERITEQELNAGTFRWNQHWWRIARIPVPEALTVIATEGKNNAADRKRLKECVVGVATLLVVLMTTTPFLPEEKPKPKVVAQTKVELKEPKWIPPTPEQLKPPPPAPKPPPPPPPKKEPPKLIQLTKKPDVKPSPIPRVKPAGGKPKAAPGPAKPQLSKSPKPDGKPLGSKGRATAPPAPPRKLPPGSPPPPSAEQLRQAEIARAKSEISQSLNFLSPSKNRARAAVEVGDDNTTDNAAARYDNKPGVVGATGKPGASALTDIEQGASVADGPIQTRGSRSLRNDGAYGSGDGRGEAMGRVQGKVALNSLYSGGGGGEGLGEGGSGLSISGSGEISESAIAKALEKALPRFQYCYEKALLTDASLAGTIVLQWTIDTNARVSDTKVVRSQLNNSTLHSCLSAELSKVRFPAPKGSSVSIRYPFAFSSSSL